MLLLAAVITTLGLLACGASWAGPADEERPAGDKRIMSGFASILPARTVQLLLATDVTRTLDGLPETSIYKLWKEAEVQAFLEPILPHLKGLTGELEQTGKFRFADIASVFKGQVAIAFVDFKVKGEPPKPEIEVALLADVADREAAMRLIKALADAAEGGGAKVTRLDFGEMAMGRIGSDDPTEPCVNYALSETALYATLELPEGKLMQELARAARGEVPIEETLAGDPEFLHAAGRMGERTELLVYLDCKRAAGLAFELSGARAGREQIVIARKVFDLLGLDAVKSVWAVDALDAPGFVSQVFVHAPAPRKGVFRLVSERPVRPEMLKVIPADAGSFAAVRMMAEEILPLVKDLARAVDPRVAEQVEKGLELLKAVVGIDVEEQVLGALGEEIVFMLAGGAGAMMGPMGPSAGMVLMVRVSDREKFGRAYETLMGMAAGLAAAQRMQIKEEALSRDVSVKYVQIPMVPMLSPAVALTEDFLVIGLTKDAVKRAYSLLRGAENPIVASPEYKETLQRVGLEEGWLVSFQGPSRPEDIAGTLAMAPVATPFLARAASARGVPENLRALIRSIDLARVPSAETLTKHGLPSAAVGFADEEGVGLTTWAPVGLVSTVGAVYGGIGAGVALPALARARGRARQVRCMSNLRQVGMGLQIYAADHKEEFPARLRDLVPKYVTIERVLRCPVSGQEYIYFSGLKATDPPGYIIAAEEPGAHGRYVNVLFIGGTVARLTASSLDRRLDRQAQQLRSRGRNVRVIRAGGAKAPGEIEEFF